MKPILAIVGRPNVGKSTLFNKIAGRRISIVDGMPGVTRDRVYADTEWLRHSFTLIDTGGLDPESDDDLTRQVFHQAELAMETADVIAFVTDVKTGPLEADMDVANLLRRANKPVVLVVNKIDDMRHENLDIYAFYALSLGVPIAVSAGQGLGIGDLLDEIVQHFPTPKPEPEEDGVIRVAVAGRPNVGKSSLINKILGESRLIVSDIPGTTRDAVDSDVEKNGQRYTFIDTAGIRRKSRMKGDIERYSIVRAIAAVQRADVCVLLISAEEGIAEQDAKIAGIAHEAGKASVIAVNKWDAIEKDDKTMNQYLKDIAASLAFMPYAPKVFISALTGQRLDKVFDAVYAAYQNYCLRVGTGVLNEVLTEAAAIHQPPVDKGRQLKIYYATQASVKPPTFVLFVNDAGLMH
ncbi:MAG: ribosome biogenesis GTPase Der, partial [Clostridiales bacterium]|nr:ribosome biogenesis GTPase Der [Clostridiales bacterium]